MRCNECEKSCEFKWEYCCCDYCVHKEKTPASSICQECINGICKFRAKKGSN